MGGNTRLTTDVDLTRRLDESLVRSLHALLVEASVSGAAAKLGMSQPAVSRHLKALRELTGDLLLIRVGNRMILTERAETLIAPTRRILFDLSLLSNERDVFEPASASYTFRLATFDTLPQSFYGQLTERVTKASPNSELVIRGLGDRFVHYRQLGEGAIDAAITVWPELPSNLRVVRLITDPIVCVLRNGHPLAEGTLDLDSFKRANHLSSPEHLPGQGSLFDVLLSEIGITVKTAVRTQYFGLAAEILARTDLILSTGRMFAEGLVAHHPLAILPFPAPIKPLRHNLVWHERSHKHQAHSWFRAEIVSAAKALRT